MVMAWYDVRCRLVQFSIAFMFLARTITSSAWITTITNCQRRCLTALPLSTKQTALAVAPSKKFVPFPFAYHQELELVIETITNRGLGIGRIDVNDNDNTTSKKWVVMVPNVIPGERVKVRIFRNMPNYSEADLIEILQNSPDRVTPKCSLSYECGGCQYQHMSISKQRHWKRVHVEEALQHYGLLTTAAVCEVVQPCLGTDHVYGYRSKLTPHFQAPVKRKRGLSNEVDQEVSSMIQAIGFQKQTSRSILDVPFCPIATDAVNLEYARLRQQLLSLPSGRSKGMTLLLRQANLDHDAVTTNPKDSITTNVRGIQFTYLAGNFFQNNYHVLPLMVDLVVEEASKVGAAKLPMTHLVDCYCGSGLFALSAAHRFQTTIGIEINDKAVGEAKANAFANGIHNCDFEAANAESIFDSIWDSYPRESTVVLLDPPRKGCSLEFLQQLLAFGPQRVVYLSCDPVTQARDARLLVDAGYRITLVQPIDLFPMTRHIECLIVLEKTAS